MNKMKKLFTGLMTLAMLFSTVPSVVASAAPDEPDAKLGSLTIKKYEMLDVKRGENGPNVPEIDESTLTGVTPLGGVEYTIQRVESFDGHDWVDVTGQPELKGTTDATGTYVFENLPLGRYEVTETGVPDHVIGNLKTFKVDIPMTYDDGAQVSYDVTIYPKNETLMTGLEIWKTGIPMRSESPTTPADLADVRFGLYKADGTYVGEAITSRVGIPGAGSIAVFNDIPYGDYYLQEMSTVGNYALNNQKIPFTVRKINDYDPDGPYREHVEINLSEIDGYARHNVFSDFGNVVSIMNYPVPEIEKDVDGTDVKYVDRDEVFKYNITIKTPDDLHTYSMLGVFDELDDRLEYAGDWSVTGVDKAAVNFTQDGQRLDWKISDVSAIPTLSPMPDEPAYTLEDIVITFNARVKADAMLTEDEKAVGIPNTATLVFDNGRGTYATEDGQPVDPVDPSDPTPPTKPLDPPTTPPVHVIPNDGGFKVIKFEKGDSSIRLEGAIFKLTTDIDGNNVVNATDTSIRVNGQGIGLLEGLTTDATGEILVEGLTPGTYYLHETKAPTFVENGETISYRMLTKPVTVVVAHNNVIDVMVANAKSGFNLPATGGLGALIVLAGAAGLVIKGRRRKENGDVIE